MKRLAGILPLVALLSLPSCKGHDKKIVVYSTGDIQLDNSKTNITVSDGTAQQEQTLDFKGSDPVTLNVQSPSGKASLEAKDDGLYIANLKANDTLIGSYQHVGQDAGEVHIGQDALKQKLDSLQKLVLGQNVSAENRNYFILPNQIGKVSSEPGGKIFGPYTVIPGSFDAGSVPEIYKFYSIKEVREIIVKLSAMSDSKPAAPAADGQTDKK